MVKRGLGTALAAAALLVSATASQAADFRIDPGRSFVQFKISLLGISLMTGTLDTLSGRFTFDPRAGSEGQSVSVQIDTASVDSGDAEYDKELRSAGFLNVDEFPTATFVSTGYEGNTEGGIITGDLTLRGITKPIAIAVQKVGERKGLGGSCRAVFKGTVSLVRRDFGIGSTLFSEVESMELVLFVEGIRQ